MNKMDKLLQELLPTVMAPRHEKLERTPINTDRIVVAENGIFLEVARSWCYFVRKIASTSYRLPYGMLEEQSEITLPVIPTAMISEFVRYAKNHPAYEVGAVIIWNSRSREFRYEELKAISADEDELVYEHPALEDDEEVVIDFHSHSRGVAFFSSKDDADDMNSVRFAVVVGNCDRAVVTHKARLCVYSIFQEVKMEVA